MKNILLIKLRYIGDVVLTTPVLQKLREHYPDSKIVCLVNAGTEEVLQHNPYVDEILVVDRGGIIGQVEFGLALRKREFDCVIDLTDGDRSALLSWISGAKVRIGFNREKRWRGRLYTECIPVQGQRRHMVDQHGRVLSHVGINSVVPGDPKVYVSEDDEQRAHAYLLEHSLTSSRWVMIHPTARYWFKAWPPDRFAALSDQLFDLGIRVVLVGNVHERSVGEDIQRNAKHPCVSLMGQTKLLELAALMKYAALFIGNDGGPMHLAVAVGCPVLGLFGPTNPAVWGPRGEKTAVIFKGLDCRECFHPGCSRGEESCMKQISVDEVCTAALDLLNGQED